MSSRCIRNCWSVDLERLKRQISICTGLKMIGSRAQSFEVGFAEFVRKNPDIASRDWTEDGLIEALAQHMVVPETYFFREKAAVEGLLTQIKSQNQFANKPLRAWSAGCSTGEEAYSLAILTKEFALTSNFQIVGTDISQEAISVASKATYGSWSLRALSVKEHNKYFSRNGEDQYVLKPEYIEGNVTFVRENLLGASTAIALYDLILCRNVLIYFDKEGIAEAARKLFEALKEGGYLLTSASDPPLDKYAPFTVQNTSFGQIYTRAQCPQSTKMSDIRQPLMSSARAGRHSETPTRADTPDEKTGTKSKDAARQAYGSGDWNKVNSLLEEDLDASSLSLRVRSLINSKKLNEACKLALDECDKDPQNKVAHTLLALVFLSARQITKAIECAKQAIRIDQDFAFAHFALGIAYYCGADYKHAQEAFGNALSAIQGLSDDTVIECAEMRRAEFASDVYRYQNMTQSRR